MSYISWDISYARVDEGVFSTIASHEYIMLYYYKLRHNGTIEWYILCVWTKDSGGHEIRHEH